MKKKIIALLLTLISSQTFAQDLHKRIHDLGYTQDYIYESTPNNNVPPPQREKHNSESRERQPLQTADFLKPRVYSHGESTNMIPLLLKLQKQNPTSVKLTRKLAPTCLKAGQFREALYWYTQTYLRDRSDLESLWNMASLAHSLGMKNEARKYLKEYAEIDPNSAWGRMSQEFLNGEYSNNLKDGFKKQLPRCGSVTEGASDSGTEILVVEGRSTDVETFINDYQPRIPEKPLNLYKTKDKTSKKTIAKKGSAKKANIKKANIKKASVKKASVKKANVKKANVKKPLKRENIKRRKPGPLGKAAIKNKNVTVTAKPL